MKSIFLSTVGAAAMVAVFSPSSATASLLVEQWSGGGNGGLAAADAEIAAGPADISGLFSIIDFTDDPAGFAGGIPGSSPWPLAADAGATGFSHPLNQNFVARVSGNILISAADNYTFRTFNDDGVRLRVGGTDVIVDNSYHPEQQFTGTIFLTPGSYPIELVFFEGGGEASLEFTVAQGSGAFGHIGTTLPTSTVADPGSSLALLGIAFGGLAMFKRRRS